MATKKTVKKTDEIIEEAAAEKIEEVKPAAKKTTKKAAAKVEEKAEEVKTAAKKTTKKAAAKVEEKAEEVKTAAKKTTRKVAAKVEETAAEVKTAAKKTTKKAAAKVEEVAEKVEEKIEEAKPAARKPAKKTAKKAEAPAEAPAPVEEAPAAEAPAPVEEAPAPVEEVPAPVEEAPVEEKPVERELPQPRRSICFIGSECYPFVKTGGLGDVMYALPRALTKLNCDVKVILPRYKCIPEHYQLQMVYRGAFDMDLCADGRKFYVGIMEYEMDGVVYDFIDNEEFFTSGNPYLNLVDDIPKFCYFSKAALAALNYLNWVPDIIHCHDWQAALVPVYLRTLFAGTPVSHAASVLTIHNLRFQGVYNTPTIRYWSGLPEGLFNMDVFTTNWLDANMLKAGLAYADSITTVSATYAGEIQTPYYGEGLDGHLRHHSYKLRGIVNGIDTEIWDSSTDKLLEFPYSVKDVWEKKKENKKALQKELGLEVDENKMVLGLISRLTDQKGLDLFNAVVPGLIDGNTQIVILGTGDPQYEGSFRWFEETYKGQVCSNIMYDEARAHHIYAGADALLVPSRFEPCGLTQLIAMRYGTVPIVRETGGLKDTVEPYNHYTGEGNGFTFDRYEAHLLYDAINRAKTIYFTERERWDYVVLRDMQKDVSWENSAWQYRGLYLELKP